MSTYVLLRHPSANRVYADAAAHLTRTEMQLSCPFAQQVAESHVAGISYLNFSAPELGTDELLQIARQSSAFALFEREGDALRPIELPDPFGLDDDLVTIPKYQGKTNEQFTALLYTVTMAAIERCADGPRRILDPMCGRGTTLATALRYGAHAAGVEVDAKAFELMAAFWKTWLRRKRIRHSADVIRVRRDGKHLGKCFEAKIDTRLGQRTLTVYLGDTRDSAMLHGKKKFDAIITDAPYGVVHGSRSDVRGQGKKDRTPAGLLEQAIPVWTRQLYSGGVLTISWNTFGLAREDMVQMLTEAGLHVKDWDMFAHRVDASIKRDVIVAVRPRD